MKITFLGTGTSLGVPALGCDCAVCRSSDPRNQRLRTSALLEIGDIKLLIDAGPDLRTQSLRAGLRHLDGVLLTHAHADHIGGIDDLRAFNFAMHASLPLYADEATLVQVKNRFDYAFNIVVDGSTKPLIDPFTFSGPFEVAGVAITPLPIMHGTWAIHGFRVGKLAYLTDVSAIPDATYELLTGLDLLVLSALRYEPHPTHFTLQQALDAIALIQPRQALLVHMSHTFDHETVNASLPPHIQLAYDGQVVEL
jgi:phosphoribosyl 1,2-cyclic phosphate phosphodiesterase